jgi:GNAT superfamily N-acetyltransferase
MEIRTILPDQLAIYATIPISFWVHTIYRIEVVETGLGGFRLREEKVEKPWFKDYDTEESPLEWSKLFDLSQWGFFMAYEGESPVAGTAVALNTPGVNLLEGRKDLAVLWDLRVIPNLRGTGIGRLLFLHAADWARKRGCRQMKIETQNINVPACRFYSRMGCELGMIHRFGYAANPSAANEVMLFWYYSL